MATLIVEDNTGLVDANVYASVDEFRQFAKLNGMEIEDVEDEQVAIYLVRATNFIDSFENRMVGKRLNPEQALAFPRQQSNYAYRKGADYPYTNLIADVLFGKFPMVERYLNQYLVNNGFTLSVGR